VKYSSMTKALLEWYSSNARELPWRGKGDPYAIWVSEVMLQQTRVDTVIPYFNRWMQTFPDIPALAAASQHEVLAAWEGLGYYSRARNLHRAAEYVVEEFGGKLPSEVEKLCKLPGIGRYTSAAIASIAFGIDVPVLDGNVRRVLARLFNVSMPVRSSAAEKQLLDLAAIHLPPGRAAEYNQALMDFGALVCTPRSPGCNQCPLVDNCQAFHHGIQEQLPVRRARTNVPHHTVTAAVICKDQRVLITQRPERGLLGGLWEFPGGKRHSDEDLEACLKREIIEEIGVEISVGANIGVYQHAYSHFRVTLHAFKCKLPSGEEPVALQVKDLRWVDFMALPEYPMGKIDRQISTDLISIGKSLC